MQRLGATLARIAGALLFVSVCLVAKAGAHPAGIGSINRYLGVECGSNGRLRLAYLLDFAELPAYGEIEKLDASHDGRVTPEEQASYLDRLLPPIVDSWLVTIDGKREVPRIVARSLESMPGQGGLSTLRINVELELVDVAKGREIAIRVRDENYSEHPGWRQMAAVDSADGSVVSSSVPEASAPLDYERSPGNEAPRVDSAEFELSCGARRDLAGTPSSGRIFPAQLLDPRLAELTSLIRDRRSGLGVTLAALGLALLLGAVHALSPGHGKALVGFYLAGSRSAPRDAFVLGALFTLAHTSSVLAFGVFALAIEEKLGATRWLTLLELASGLFIVLLGLEQLPRRWRQFLDGHGTGDHSHAHGTSTQDASRSSSTLDAPGRRSWREVILFGISGGIVPCPGAMVLLLAAIALHRAAFGLVLVGFFSLGLALVLIFVGLAFVLARRTFERLPWNGRFLRALPVLSSVCVVLLGALISLSALSVQ